MNAKNPQQPQETQDSAVVYQETIFGLHGTKVSGNRLNDPISAFKTFWARVLMIPPNPLFIVLDAGVWVMSSALSVLACNMFPALTGFIMIPYAAFVLGLAVAVWYLPELRLLSGIRLILLILGILLAL
jgi:hypothetical protein